MREETRNGQHKLKIPSISYFTLFRFATKQDCILITIGLLASFISGISLSYSITLVSNGFQSMINYAKADKSAETEAYFLNEIQDFVRKYSCIGGLLLLGGYLGTALMNITAIRQVLKLRQEYLRAALNQDFAYYDLHHTGDFASKMADDVIKLEQGIGGKLASLIYSLAVALGCIIMSLIKGWKLALLCLIPAPITFFLVGLTGWIANKLYKKQSKAKSDASMVAEEAISSIRTVYAFNGQEKEIARYRKHLIRARNLHIKKEAFTGLSMGTLFFCVFGSYAISFYFGIYLVIKEPKTYNADVMFSVFFGVMTALSNFGMVASLMNTFGSARGAGAQIFQTLDNLPTINPILNRGVKPNDFRGDIEYKNVVFHYPSRPDITVLKSVNLIIKHGQTVALVGHSGCGKSTIIQLLSRYYDIEEGSIKLDGNNVKDLSVKWLRSQIGLVWQEPVLFSTSIRENIRYGYENATNRDVEDAAKQANAHDFIMKLPLGYDTLVGERGASLSGGQKQRIAIARALVRNPRILLLDEATSALDTASEHKVQKALDKATKGRTTLIIAHRLSTIRNVDIIYVMHEGQVVESGSHDHLLNTQGYYYKMFKTVTEEEIKSSSKESLLSEEEPIMSNEKENLTILDDIDEKKVKGPSFSFRKVIMLNAPEWKLIFLGCLCSLVTGFSVPIFVVLFGDLFGSMASSDPEQLMKKVEKVSMSCIFIGCAIGLANFIETIAFGASGAYLTERLRLKMFTHLLQQHIGFFDDRSHSTGALCARLSSEAAYVQGATGQQVAVEAVSNIRTVAALGLERRVVSEYTNLLLPALVTAKCAAHWRGVVTGLSRSLFHFVNAAALTYGSHLIVSDGIAYEDVLIATQSLQMASNQAQNAFAYAPDFHRGVNAAARIKQLLDTKPTIQDPEDYINFEARGGATFKNVEFSYPTRPTVKVLRGLNLQIDIGKTIAIVGESGCGKSTVIQLLLRYYDPISGCIMLDDLPLTRLRMSDIRGCFGIVSQEPMLFDRTISENIAYGESRNVTQQEVIDAARLANIHDFIVSLPKGYETDIGSKGIQLSGGQKQRVAIARALIRHPKILLLDEATSALDNESEKVVQEALEGAKASRTCVIIAHRLSTVRDADLICVLSDGRLAEVGTHTHLMQLKGMYYSMVVK
ncbi:ATP-dependent translocase ABCB1-like isoform X5 [Pieris napi]|uniref:ATP-dependent translocase ABCB1-like isoform X5 n=1 Tax=Pieris napi TaxID=78633 RepID=UPI001FBA2D4E|nr:ATP-dependent translocase ABCB1-like isoform X5 [Pieris napi]